MRFFGQALLAVIPTGFTAWRASALFLATMLALSGCLQQAEAITDGAASFAADDGGVAVDDGGVAVDDGEAISVTGELTVLYMDDFDNKRAELQYFIEDKQSKKKFKLKFKDTPPGHLRNGTQVSLRGKAKGKEIILAADDVDAPPDASAPSNAAVTGEQKTLVMVANFSDASVSCPINDIRDLMFTHAADQSIDDLYQEMSFGSTWLSGQVVGDYNVNFSTTDTCDIEAWGNAAEAAASADGINVAEYPRRVYVMPRNSCPGSGYGTVGGNSSRAWVFTCHLPDVFAHELGHNIGMGHAGTPDWTYGDTSDVMGLGGQGLRQVNAPHKEQMGWLADAPAQLVTNSGFYDVAPLELNSSSAIAPRSLKIHKPDTDEYYYLSYRRAIGFDANLSGSRYLDHVTVHRYLGDGSGSRTYVLSTLADNESFQDTVNGISVTQITHNNDYATVEVSLSGSDPAPTCAAAAPQASLSPSDQSGNPGSTLSYTVSVTNLDSNACPASSFSLDYAVPGDWTGNVSPSSLSLAPGETGTATFMVASAAAATANTYGVSVSVMDGSEAVHTATANATYTVVNACSPGAPSLTVSPGSQNGDPGATLVYTVSLINNDSAVCSASAFDLSIGSAPAGWSASLASQSLNLAPGETGTTSLSVTSATTAAPDSYSVQVTSSDSQETMHSASANTTYVVNDTSPAGDVEPPTRPTGLSANANSRRVNLSWSASSDNIGVVGYRVYRDGVFLGTTPDTAYADRNAENGVTYAYTVAAYDAANNASEMSAPVMAAKGKRGGKGKQPKK